METNKMNIYQKMLKATERIGVVAKNLKVEITKNNAYKAVSERDILDAVKPIETELGIYSYPHTRQIVETSVLEQSKKDYQTGEYYTTKQLFMRIETVYRFINIDNPSEFVDITTYGDGVDSQDKATGKAMTYADKYALMKAYKISTGDDPDAEPSHELKGVKGNEFATPAQIRTIAKYYVGENLIKLLTANNITKLEELPRAKANDLIKILAQKSREQ